jgi:hypothetical protein
MGSTIAMEVNELIVQLAEKLDAWTERFFAMLDSDDVTIQTKALIDGVKIVKEFDRVKEEGLNAIRALLNRQVGSSQDEWAASLIQGLIFSAKLWETLHDEMPDIDAELKVQTLIRDIAKALEGIPPGRVRLAALLDHSDDIVRVVAGEHLIVMDLMPESVVPVLRSIHEKNEGELANIRAGLVLFAWELKQKERAGKTT